MERERERWTDLACLRVDGGREGVGYADHNIEEREGRHRDGQGHTNNWYGDMQIGEVEGSTEETGEGREGLQQSEDGRMTIS